MEWLEVHVREVGRPARWLLNIAREPGRSQIGNSTACDAMEGSQEMPDRETRCPIPGPSRKRPTSVGIE